MLDNAYQYSARSSEHVEHPASLRKEHKRKVLHRRELLQLHWKLANDLVQVSNQVGRDIAGEVCERPLRQLGIQFESTQSFGRVVAQGSCAVHRKRKLDPIESLRYE